MKRLRGHPRKPLAQASCVSFRISTSATGPRFGLVLRRLFISLARSDGRPTNGCLIAEPRVELFHMLPPEPSSYKGYWWLPSFPKQKLPGTLSISPASGIVLEITGSFDGRTFPFGNRENYRSVHGETSGNEVLTLEFLHSGPREWGATGVMVTKYDAGCAIIGGHFPNSTEVLVSELHAELGPLAEWLCISGFSFSAAGTEETRASLTVQYRLPEPIEIFRTEDHFWEIRWKPLGPTRRNPQTEVHMSEVPYVRFQSTKPVPFDSLHSHVEQFRRLLTLFVGSPAHVTRLLGIVQQDGETFTVEFIWKSRFEPRPSEVRSFDIVAHYQSIRSHLPSIIAFFRDNQKAVAPVLDLWSLIPMLQEMPIEQRFLGQCQIAEAFHRRTMNRLAKPEVDYARDLLRSWRRSPRSTAAGWIGCCATATNARYRTE